MQFEFRHEFSCDGPALWALLQSDAYRLAACEQSSIDKHLLEDRAEAAWHFRKVRVVPRRTLPAPLARAVGKDRLSYVQEQRWLRERTVMKWVVISDISPERVTCRGEVVVTDRGRGRSERRVWGELRVAVPVVGPRIEQKVAEDLRASYERTAEVLHDLLAKGWTPPGASAS